VLPLPTSSTLSFPSGNPVASYVFFLVFPSLLSILPSIFPSITCFRKQFLHEMRRIQFYFIIFIALQHSFPTSLYVILHFSHDPSKLIFSILLQHHISKLSIYFWSNSRSVQFSASYISYHTYIHTHSHTYIGRFHPFHRPRRPLGRAEVQLYSVFRLRH
jgi:hypothetical protein